MIFNETLGEFIVLYIILCCEDGNELVNFIRMWVFQGILHTAWGNWIVLILKFCNETYSFIRCVPFVNWWMRLLYDGFSIICKYRMVGGC
jgi:hypothetical protein